MYIQYTAEHHLIIYCWLLFIVQRVAFIFDIFFYSVVNVADGPRYP